MTGLLSLAIDILCLLIIAVAIVSWVAPNSRHSAILLLKSITDPILQWVRKILPPINGIDLSPLLLILVLRLLQRHFL